MSVANYMANKILDYNFSQAAYTVPATLYMALSTSPIVATDTSAAGEVTGNAYARVAVTNNASNFPASALASKTNGNSISFPESTGTWGTITYIAFFDALSGGNLIYFEALPVAKTVQAQTTVVFSTGALTISMS
jgi:hypothetical protein